MPVDDPAADEPDHLLVLALGLAQANAALALAHVKHEAVRKRLGTRAPPPSKLPREVPRPSAGSSAYRGKDELVELQRAIDEAKVAGSTLRSETSTLESECPMEFAPPPFGTTGLGLFVLTVGTIAGMGGVFWLMNAVGGEAALGALPIVALLVAAYVKLFAQKPSSPE